VFREVSSDRHDPGDLRREPVLSAVTPRFTDHIDQTKL